MKIVIDGEILKADRCREGYRNEQKLDIDVIKKEIFNRINSE